MLLKNVFFCDIIILRHQFVKFAEGDIMLAICFGSLGLGLLIGLIFSLLFISFDAGWKKILSVVFAFGTSGTGLWGIYEKYNINDYNQVFTSVGVFCIAFLATYILFMIVMCKIMKDKDNKDILRIRDIILGQKKYIETYYSTRAKEIDEKLNIPTLKKRELEVDKREKNCAAQLEIIEREKAEIEKITEDKLKIKLPENKQLVVTKEFLDLLPTYAEEFASFIEGIRKETTLFLENHEKATHEDLKVFLMILSIQILEHLFGKSARDVRVHFRYYDEKKNGYKKIICMIGSKESKRDLTFIPYDEANMIIRSFECKRALIKSHNIKYDFTGNNSTTWTEYMTGTFYNITRNAKPCLSFGISVKNSTKFKNQFNFLNYCKIESFLQEVIEQFDERYNIETLLYDKS